MKRKPNIGKRTYTEEQFRMAIAESKTIKESLNKLGLGIGGGNYPSFHQLVVEFNIDISHFKGAMPPNAINKRPIEDYFNGTPTNGSYSFKKRLIVEGFFKEKCSICELEKWRGKKIPLELDHINGDRHNNKLENLRLLCPNCHAQTPTYCRGLRKKKLYSCIDCSANIGKKSKRCRSCASKICYSNYKEKIKWPSDEKLAEMVRNTPRSILKTMLGVSDNAISKRCQNRNIDQPPRGYWTKVKFGKI